MLLRMNTLKRTISGLGLSALLLAAMGSTAFAHRTGRQHNHGRHAGWARRDANRDSQLRRQQLKAHQKAERRTLKQHHKSERREISSDGSMRDLSQHQRQERRVLNTHQRQERRAAKSNNGHRHR